jgi:cellulose synthase/poly-beta-1,6-N-acetylglucosamine synthase-like glycosyltransferase
MKLLGVAAGLAAVPFAAASGYLFALAVGSRRPTSFVKPTGDLPRFDLFVPAHNEEAGIAATVKSLREVDYPADRYRVVVIADNCSDQTAARAREAGAHVLERNDTTLRGKGYALKHAFAWGKADGFASAAVVVDADTIVSPNLLEAYAARLLDGADALQADYGVRNPEASWRTQLMTIALSTFHEVRSVTRERLGLSCGLRGNGMCFTYAILDRVPYDAFSLVEDVEYGLSLGEQGCAIRYVGEAHVYGEMVSGEKASRSQRKRWEEGRRALVRSKGWPMLWRGLQTRNAVLFDLAVDLVIPPLASLVVAEVIGIIGTSALLVLTGSGALALVVWSASAGGLVYYVFRGWRLSGTGMKGLLALGRAPAYVLWKLSLKFQGAEKRAAAANAVTGEPEWVRTTREGS